jgi:hypothetical protein
MDLDLAVGTEITRDRVVIYRRILCGRGYNWKQLLKFHGLHVD